MKRTISLVLVLALGLATEAAKADFNFGTPNNLGPTVNSSVSDESPSLSADGLILVFFSGRSGGYGETDLWMTTRATTTEPWGEPVNLGPSINSPQTDWCPSLSPDGCTLYYASRRPGGIGNSDIWMSMRATRDDDWSASINLGPIVNSGGNDGTPFISSDGLELYFTSANRPGGHGGNDIWVSTRETKDSEWGTPVNLSPVVNSGQEELWPMLSADSLSLFFSSGLLGSARPDGLGGSDIWMARRKSRDAEWGEPVNLGAPINSSSSEWSPSISTDGSTLYFTAGGFGSGNLYQVSIEPVVDLNSDGIVDSTDICIMVDHWGTDEPLCDIGPMPWGDGIIDVQDLIVLAEHLFEGIPPVEPEEVNVDEKDDSSQVELEQGQLLVVTLESNPTTGYRWEVAEIQESILEQMGEAEFKSSEAGEPPLVGAGGWEIFRFKAISAGQTSLKLVYHRPWEEGVEPVKTFSIQVVVN